MQHKSPTNNRAKTPYNFVPLPEKVLQAAEPPPRDCYHDGKFTGYIELKITTETPLYTRCAFPPEVWNDASKLEKGSPKVTQVRECQDFFYRGDKDVPVIPGSTLRGMTRSLVEIFSYSKINFVTDSQLVYRSIRDTFYRDSFVKSTTPNPQVLDYPLAKVKGGYLKFEKGKYWISPAKEFSGESFIHLENSRLRAIISNLQQQRVYTNLYVAPPASRITRPTSNRPNISLKLAITNTLTDAAGVGLEKVNVVVSGHMQNKHMHCAIYEVDVAAAPIEIPEERWKIYQDDYKKVLDKNKPQRELQVGQPLFYFIDANGKPVFGSTMMFRLHYKKTVRKFLDEDSQKANLFDLTAAIFGKVPEKKDSEQKSFAGRVYFSDAVCLTSSPFLDGANDDGRRVPQILSSPKPTAFQLYLNQPDPSNPNKKTYNNAGETQIRGFKRYWHKPNVTGDEVFDREKERNINDVGSQHTIIRPVKPAMNFESRVYFENLTKIELGALLTALDLPEGKRHQIGMAKPYGLGSVKIEPTLVLQNRRKRYESLFDGDDWATGKDDNLIEDFKKDFADEILKFHNTVICQNDSVSSLEEIPRLNQLYTMLEWKDPKNMDEKVYVGFEDGNGRQWKARFVLPFPQHVESGESGAIETCVSQRSEVPISQSADNSDETAQVEEVIEPVETVTQTATRTTAEMIEAEQRRTEHLLSEIEKITDNDEAKINSIYKSIDKHYLPLVAATLIKKVDTLGFLEGTKKPRWYKKTKKIADDKDLAE